MGIPVEEITEEALPFILKGMMRAESVAFFQKYRHLVDNLEIALNR